MIPPIIMLHHVSDDPVHQALGAYCIQRKSFTRLLNYLTDHQIDTITFRQLTSNNAGNDTAGKVILTFDDCSKSLFDFAVPELIKRNQSACFYMPTAHLGQNNSWDVAEGRPAIELMNESDLKTLHDYGMEVGSHAHHHIKLESLDEASVRNELWTSKSYLDNLLQVDTVSFAYPFASVPHNYYNLLQAAGFHYGLGIYQSRPDRFALRRIGYYDKDDETRIGLKLSATYKWYRSLSDPLKKLVNKV